jgi:adenylate cyclase
MGDTMNLASRLEGACKQYKIATLISEETRDMVKDEIVTREIDQIRVVGKKKPVRVFELVGDREETPAGEIEKAALFEGGIEAYRNRDWDGAIDVFRRLGEDVPAGIYVRRCLAFKQSPPPPEWDGIFELGEK